MGNASDGERMAPLSGVTRSLSACPSTPRASTRAVPIPLASRNGDLSVTTRLRPRPAAATRLDALAVAILLLCCACWGVQQVASKVALSQGMPPVLQALLRSVVAGPLLLLWFWLRRGRAGLRSLLARDGTLWPGLLTAALFAVEFIALFYGVRLTSASHAVIILFSGGFFTALGTHLLVPGEQLRLVNLAGLVLAFLGVVVTMSGGSAGSASLLGDLLVLAAAANWGLTTVVVKASPALAAATPEKVLAYQVIGSFPILLVTAALGGELRVPAATPLAWASVAYQGVVIVFATYLTWFWLITRYPAGRIAAFSFLTPLFGVVAAALLLGEPLTPMLLLGLACTAVGLRLVNRG